MEIGDISAHDAEIFCIVDSWKTFRNATVYNFIIWMHVACKIEPNICKCMYLTCGYHPRYCVHGWHLSQACTQKMLPDEAKNTYTHSLDINFNENPSSHTLLKFGHLLCEGSKSAIYRCNHLLGDVILPPQEIIQKCALLYPPPPPP